MLIAFQGQTNLVDVPLLILESFVIYQEVKEVAGARTQWFPSQNLNVVPKMRWWR